MEKHAIQPERTLWNRCNKRLVLESVVLIVILAVAPSHVFAQTFTIIDVPGALDTRVNGIGPNGQIVGDYENSGSGPRHGFVLDRGVFTTIDAPGTGQTPGNMTFAMAINARGQVVGFYIVNFLVRGFLFDHGVFTTIDASIYVPGAYGTRLNGINSRGQIVGQYQDSVGYHGFLLDHGVFTTIDLDSPGPPFQESYTIATGISDSGKIIGWYYKADVYYYRGFVLDHGVVSDVVFPCARHNEALGINARGQIVGYVTDQFSGDCGGPHGLGFLLDGDVFTFIDVPGAWFTKATGINARGQIVGYWAHEVTGLVHGFLVEGLIH